MQNQINQDIGEEIINKLKQLNKILDEKNGRDELTIAHNSQHKPVREA